MKKDRFKDTQLPEMLYGRQKKTPDPDEYTKEYFLTDCGGFKEYLQGKLSLRHQKALEYLAVNPGEVILDIGCGRGELLSACREKGGVPVGIDYSSAAITISKRGKENPNLIQASATALPFREETFDKVIMLDIVEHLSATDLMICLRDVKRVLKTGGQVLIHTPNQWGDSLAVLYVKISSILRPWQKKKNVSPSTHSYSTLHVNVLNPISLSRVLRTAGFKSKIWFAGHPLRDVPFTWYLADKLLFFVTTMWCKAYKV